jgi:hypothetical protein
MQNRFLNALLSDLTENDNLIRLTRKPSADREKNFITPSGHTIRRQRRRSSMFSTCGGEKRTRREGRLTRGLAICSNPKSDMTDKLKLKVGEALPGFRFKPGECFVNSTWGEEFRQGKSTPKQFDALTREQGERANAFLKIRWKWLLSQDGNKEARGGGSSEGEADQ